MATRGEIQVYDAGEMITKDKDGHFPAGYELCDIYVHFDGYPEYLGVRLGEICKGKIVKNGYSSSSTENIANGMSCLAAQIIALLKLDDAGVVQPGNVSLQNSKSRAGDTEWRYQVYLDDNRQVKIKVISLNLNRLIFEGTPEEVIHEFEDKMLEAIE